MTALTADRIDLVDVIDIVDLKRQCGQPRQQDPQVNTVNAVNKVNTVQTPSCPPEGDIVVGTFHVPSTVINQEPIDLMPAAQRCLPAHALASYLSIPVTRTVREAAAVHG